MNAEPPLLADWQGSACRLRLNRPAQGNALSATLVDALDQALAEARARGATLLLLEGAGKHFCTGFDLSALDQETDDSLLARFTRIELMLQRLHRMPCPTVALAHGRAMGAGADLFAACRYRLAAPGSVYAFPGFAGFGLVLGSRRLAARVGRTHALDWICSGRPVDAPQALAAGLATAPADGADRWQQALAAAAAPKPPAVLDSALDADDAADLAALVRSAAVPGLRARIEAFRAQQARARESTARA